MGFKRGLSLQPYLIWLVDLDFLKQINYFISLINKSGQLDHFHWRPINWVNSDFWNVTFCSNEYLKGTDPLIIMSISGHKSNKSFIRYIKVSGGPIYWYVREICANREGVIVLCIRNYQIQLNWLFLTTNRIALIVRSKKYAIRCVVSLNPLIISKIRTIN